MTAACSHSGSGCGGSGAPAPVSSVSSRSTSKAKISKNSTPKNSGGVPGRSPSTRSTPTGSRQLTGHPQKITLLSILPQKRGKGEEWNMACTASNQANAPATGNPARTAPRAATEAASQGPGRTLLPRICKTTNKSPTWAYCPSRRASVHGHPSCPPVGFSRRQGGHGAQGSRLQGPGLLS